MSTIISKVTTEVDTSTLYKVRIFKNATPAEIIIAMDKLPINTPLEITFVTTSFGEDYLDSGTESHVLLTAKVVEGFSE
jgi:hypothetical protein